VAANSDLLLCTDNDGISSYKEEKTELLLFFAYGFSIRTIFKAEIFPVRTLSTILKTNSKDGTS